MVTSRDFDCSCARPRPAGGPAGQKARSSLYKRTPHRGAYASASVLYDYYVLDVLDYVRTEVASTVGTNVQRLPSQPTPSRPPSHLSTEYCTAQLLVIVYRPPCIGTVPCVIKIVHSHHTLAQLRQNAHTCGRQITFWVAKEARWTPIQRSRPAARSARCRQLTAVIVVSPGTR